MTDVDFDSLCDNITKLARQRYKNYVHAENFDDAVQEGRIWAWRQIHEKGITDYRHLLNTGVRHIWNHLHPETHHQPTGHVRTSKPNKISDHQLALIEKITAYTEEYVKLHNRKPQQVTIAADLGLSANQVASALRRMSNRGNTAVILNQYGRISKFTAIPISMLEVASDGGERELDRHPAMAIPSFENDLISSVNFDRLLGLLDEREGKALRLKHQMCMTEAEIAREIGFSQMTAHRVVARAHEKLTHYLTYGFIPEETRVYVLPPPRPKKVSLKKKLKSRKGIGGRRRSDKCQRGHEWTPDNTRIRVYKGKETRVCRACEAIRDKERRAKK